MFSRILCDQARRTKSKLSRERVAGSGSPGRSPARYFALALLLGAPRGSKLKLQGKVR